MDVERRKSHGVVALVVDDDVTIRDLIAASLRRQKIRVESCADGEEAIPLLQKEDYRTLILDLMMPKVSGWDVIDWLTRHPSRKPHTVIVITAADREVVNELDPHVVNAVIFKPFDVFDLTSYVKSCCSHDEPIDRRQRRIIQ